MQHQPRRQSAQHGNHRPLPRRNHFRDFHRVARMAEEEARDFFNRDKEEQIDDAADDTDDAGQREMEGLLPHVELLAQLEGAPPIAAHHRLRASEDLLGEASGTGPKLHLPNLTRLGGFGR